MGEYEKTFRVDMTAEIITLDSSVLTKMKERYDGRSNVIGCEKVHIRAYYDQIISSPTFKAFESLEE